MSVTRTDVQKLGPLAPALALLALVLLINYVDRGNLSIAAPLLTSELHLSPSRLGILLSAFFWSYTAFVFFVGWLVDRFDVNVVLASGFFLWSAATAATGLAHGFAMLLAFRLLLGVGESVAFPSVSKILARTVTETHRGFANGVTTFGMKLGPAIGSLGGGLLMATYGWRAVFLGVGLIGLLWIPAWWKWMPRNPQAASMVTQPPFTGFIQIMLRRSFWGAAAGHFCGNYVLYFLVTWLPSYLHYERQLSMRQMSKVAAAYYVAEAFAALATGWVTDACVRRGGSPTLVRKSAMAIGHVIAAFGLMACAFAGPHTYLFTLFAIALGSGMFGSGIFACAQILAGPRTAGRWVGLQNGFANFAGVIGPALTGFVVEWTGRFTVALAVTAFVSLLGALSWTFFVGPLAEICWEPEPVPLIVPACASG
jgi:ACS family D-galactonate transporter-like MFS transporter